LEAGEKLTEALLVEAIREGAVLRVRPKAMLGFETQMQDAIQSGASTAINLFEQYCPVAVRGATLGGLSSRR